MWKIPLYTKWLRFATKLPGDLLQWRVRRKKRDFRASKTTSAAHHAIVQYVLSYISGAPPEISFKRGAVI